nr:DsrE family protein [uncultured Pedobacter sp.]
MKKIFFFFFAFVLITSVQPLFAQQQHEVFTGAKAHLKSYKALYVMNNADENKIKGTLRNMQNALEDPRLKGKITLELIAFGDGVQVYDKTGPFEEQLKALQKSGVVLAQCENTIRERHIYKSTLFPFISYVPSGNGEIIIRGAQGWVIVHP